MIYLDNAATTWPKPKAVIRAVSDAMTRFGANPGRSGYGFSLKTAEIVYRAREEIAAFFGLGLPDKVIFTKNCTEGLNLLIHTLAGIGGHIVVSDLEHNAVIRPLYALCRQGKISYDTATVYPMSEEKTVQAFSEKMREDTVAVICTQASNVFGICPPLHKLSAVAHRHGALFCVDGAQGAGILATDVMREGIDVYCAPGHKGLYGPMGTGIVLWNTDRLPAPLIRGGTGTRSVSPEQPGDMPELAESGTLNVPGICGLLAGIRSLDAEQNVLSNEKRCAEYLAKQLSSIPKLRVFDYINEYARSVPVVSVSVDGANSETIAEMLDRYGIAVRAGLHCAPSAHRKMGTLDTGTVRFSLSRYTTAQECAHTVAVMKKIMAEVTKNDCILG